MSAWRNSQHIVALKELWVLGLSGAQIAERLNRQFSDADYSRNACIGKIHRLGLMDDTRKKPSRPRKAPAGISVGRHVKTANGFNMKTRPGPTEDSAPGVAINPKAFQPLPGVEPVPFMELRRHHCRWPVGGEGALMVCCGAYAEGPYCPVHAVASEAPAGTAKRLDDRMGLAKMRTA